MAAAVEARRKRPLWRHLRRLLLVALLAFLLAPPALIATFRLVPPPGTPLMLIRLAEGHGLERHWVPLERISPHLVHAVIAAEDNLFCTHKGFDWRALELEWRAYRAGERPRGASTITMQTAKNLFLWPGRSFARKALEAWLTPQIELLWDKPRILEVYLNIAETGPGLYGAEAAARAYFAKGAADLSRREATLIAAILPSPLGWSASRPSQLVDRRARTIATRIDQLGPLLACTRRPAGG
jgi:monofunctional glycosyltransferase